MPLTPQRREQWRAIELLTERMEAGMAEQAWGDVAELELERRVLMEAFFAQPVADAEKDELAGFIRALMERDRAITDEGVREREAIAAKIGHVQTGRRAVQAYGGNQQL